MREKEYWYVVRSGKFSTLISAKDAKEARKLYSEVYIGKPTSASRYKILGKPVVD